LRRGPLRHSPLRHRGPKVEQKPAIPTPVVETFVELPRIQAPCTMKWIRKQTETFQEHVVAEEKPKEKPLALHKHLRKRTLSLTQAQMAEWRVPELAKTRTNVRLVSATPERRKLGMSSSPAPRFNTEKIEPVRFGLSPSKSPTKNKELSPQRNDLGESSPSRNLSVTPNLALRNLNSNPAATSNPNKSAAEFKLVKSLMN